MHTPLRPSVFETAERFYSEVEGKRNGSIFEEQRLCCRICEALVANTLSVLQEVQDDAEVDTQHSVWLISDFREAQRHCEVFLMPQFSEAAAKVRYEQHQATKT